VNRRSTIVVTTAAAAALAVAGAVGAQALWNSSSRVEVPAMPVGSVGFAAYPLGEPADVDSSTAGESVTVRLPGERLIDLTERSIDDTAPLIWRFVVRGAALGIAGLHYSVTVSSQDRAGATFDLTSGVAQPGTLLAGSTLKVYPAALGGDCSAVPVMPEPADGVERNVAVFGGEDVVLQEPGLGVSGRQTEQEWCAALSWNSAPDGRYRNDVQVSAATADGGVSGALDSWQAVIGFPPALDVTGTYRSLAHADALAADGTRGRGTARWDADLYPDSSGEPDVLITLAPAVTTARVG